MLARLQRNIYDLEYFGAAAWDTAEEAESGRIGSLTGETAEDPAMWEVKEISDNRLKLCNVKLNNNPRMRLYMAENGTFTTKPESGS